MCRGGKPVVEGARDKLSMFCQVRSVTPATAVEQFRSVLDMILSNCLPNGVAVLVVVRVAGVR